MVRESQDLSVVTYIRTKLSHDLANGIPACPVLSGMVPKITAPPTYTLATFSTWLMFFPPPLASPTAFVKAWTKSKRLLDSTFLCSLTMHLVMSCRIGLPGLGRVGLGDGSSTLRKKACRSDTAGTRTSYMVS